jgi:hypothetical protein
MRRIVIALDGHHGYCCIGGGGYADNNNNNNNNNNDNNDDGGYHRRRELYGTQRSLAPTTWFLSLARSPPFATANHVNVTYPTTVILPHHHTICGNVTSCKMGSPTTTTMHTHCTQHTRNDISPRNQQKRRRNTRLLIWEDVPTSRVVILSLQQRVKSRYVTKSVAS